MEELMLEPTKYYQHGLKEQFHNNAETFFDELTKESKIDIAANKETMDAYYKADNELKNQEKELKKVKRLRTFYLVIGIILLVALIGILFLVLRNKGIKDKELSLSRKVEEIKKKLEKLKSEAVAQVNPLVNMFDEKMVNKIINKTIPMIEFDEELTREAMFRNVTQFEYKEDPNLDHSTLVIQSGRINGNPFILRQYYQMEMVPQIYTGMLVITYTETYHDSNGTHTRTVSETLHASITRPRPDYSTHTEFVFLSDASPRLSFTRTPTQLCGKNEKQIANYIKSFEKADQKKAEKAVKKGESYTRVTNTKFEAYLNSTGRDNEVEYRMLFTPLAQNNICYHFSQTQPYSDDIYYSKNKCVNTIVSLHSQTMDYSGGTYNYVDFDYEKMKEKFLFYSEDYFQGFMYDALPILNIPLFTQHTSASFVDACEYKRNVTAYEAECLINKIDLRPYAHEETATDIIIKTVLTSRTSDGDSLDVHARSFNKIPQTELVPTLGGDGKLHGVPVPYFEYNPLDKVTPMFVQRRTKENQTKKTGNDIMKYRDFSLFTK